MSLSINLFLLEQSKGGFIITQLGLRILWRVSVFVLYAKKFNAPQNIHPPPSHHLPNYVLVLILQGMGCVCSRLMVCYWCWEYTFFCVCRALFPPPFVMVGLGGTNNLWYSSFHSLLLFLLVLFFFVPVLFPWWYGVCPRGLAPPTVYSTLYSFFSSQVFRYRLKIKGSYHFFFRTLWIFS